MGSLALHIALAVGTCTTNVIFICVVGRVKRLRTTTNLILLSMAVADLFVGIFVTPAMGIFSTIRLVVEHAYICACVHTVLLYFIIVSLSHVVLVAVERFLSFVYPLRYPAIFTHNRLYKSIALCWIAPLVITISPALGWYEDWTVNYKTSHANSFVNGSGGFNFTVAMLQKCEVKHIVSCTFTFLVSGIVGLVFIVMTYFHLRILCVTVRQIRKHRQPSVSKGSAHRSNWASFKKEARAFFLVMFVVDYFLVSWSPVGGLVFVGCLIQHSVIPDWMFKVFPLLAMTNSTMNPIVYGLAKRDIRRYVVGILCGKTGNYKKPVRCCDQRKLWWTRSLMGLPTNVSNKKKTLW